MQLSGVTIEEAGGLHADDWCHSVVRLRVRAQTEAAALAIGVWVKPEPTDAPGKAARFTLMGANRELAQHTASPGEYSEIVLPTSLQPGQELSLSLTCDNQVRDRGADRRALSFMMSSLHLRHGESARE